MQLKQQFDGSLVAVAATVILVACIASKHVFDFVPCTRFDATRVLLCHIVVRICNVHDSS